VAEFYGKKPVKSAPKAVSVRKRKTAAADTVLNNRITVLKKRLKQANEKLKPLDKKKYLEFYLDFKKRSKRLKAHLGRLNKTPGDLSQNATKKIIKNADALSTTLKSVGKKPKKKKYQKISQEIQSFSKMLKKIRS
jgi:exonuclease VII large subunit